MIPYGHQSISPDDIDAVIQILTSDWLTMGPVVEDFEARLSRLTGGNECLSVSSGTAALEAAYYAAGIGPGDEVITPPLTFVATQAALVHLGACPVYADVSLATGTVNPTAVESEISSRTVAIVAVDYAGHPAELGRLRQIADRHGLLLIEDAAHSLGSSLGGTPVGALADVTTFSFFPTKNITTGEGGAVTSPNPDIMKRARRYSHQGLVRDAQEFLLPCDGPWHQEVQELGHNFRLSDVHASLGLSQLERLEEFKSARSAIKAFYDSVFLDVEGLTLPHQEASASVMWHLYPLRVPARHRRRIFEFLRRHGVGVQVNYVPAYRHPGLARLLNQTPDCPNSEAYYASEISLPIWPGLTGDQLEFIADLVLRALNQATKRR